MYFVLILILLFIYKIYYENKITYCLKNDEPMPKIPNPNTLFKVFIAIIILFIGLVIVSFVPYSTFSNDVEYSSGVVLEVDVNYLESSEDDIRGFAFVVKSEHKHSNYKIVEIKGDELVLLDVTILNNTNETKNLIDYLSIEEGDSIINLEYTSQDLLEPIGPGESVDGNIYFEYLGDREYSIGLYSLTNEDDYVIHRISVKK